MTAPALNLDRRQRRKKYSQKALAVASIAALAFVASLLSSWQAASADPSSGQGPLTVDESGHWFEYSGNGEPYFMAGSGGPEGFLFYSDERKQEIVDQLIANDVRAVYIHAVRSDGGDGGSDENPFFGNDASNGVDPSVLDNWDSYLSQLDEAGIVTWFHLYDDGARPFGACNADLPDEEEQFVQTIVERFSDYQHLVWLPTEEHIIKACSDNDIDVEKAAALAAVIRQYDDVHPVGVHHNNGQSNQYLGNDDIDVFSQQICQQPVIRTVDGVHDAGEFGEDVYVMAECHSWHKDLLDEGDRTTLRQTFWASTMAGGYVLFYDAWESTDPTPEMLADLGRINAFMDTTRFSETVPADQLAAGDTKWVLANESVDVYIAYSNNNPDTMGVDGLSAGTYDLGWFDPISGEQVEQSVTIDGGTETFSVPSQFGSEVALSIEPSDDSPATTTTTSIPTATTTAPTTTTTAPTTTTVPPTVTREIPATDDAFIQGTTAINNDQLRVESGSRTRTSYVRFDVSGVDAAASGQLRLTVGSDEGGSELSVWLGSETGWTEDTLSTQNAPTPDGLISTVDGPFLTGTEILIPLPEGALDSDTLQIILTTTGAGSDDFSFAATEAGNGPTLILDAEPGVDNGAGADDGAGDDTDDGDTTTPTATNAILAPTEDAYLQNSSAINTGELRVQAENPTRTSYLQFDTSVVGNAEQVRLELTVGSDPGAGTISVWNSSGAEWTADTLTPAIAPQPTVVLATASSSFVTGQVVEFDLPATVVDGSLLQLTITHDGVGADDVSFVSSEGASGPQLFVVADSADDSGGTSDDPVDDEPVNDDPVNEEPADPGSVQTVLFNGTNAVVPNPERGFHEGASVRDSTGGSNSSVAALTADYDAGLRVSRMYIRLDDYKNAPVPQQLIDDLDELFENARQSGMKIIPRFAYNFGDGGDASVEQIEAHLEQLTPVIERNSDVIAVLQAGFIGKWGEWHGSTNGVDSVENQERVRNALLDALPIDRMAQFRYPADIIEFEPTPLTSADAWSGSNASRTAHKNDCFLANEGDAGTYNPLSRKTEMQEYLEVMTAFTATGGETCQVSAGNQRTDCATALEELDRFNWDYLNLGFYGNTIDKWRTDGCFDEIEARLGYRYEMQAATVSTNVQSGSLLNVDLDVTNVGFGKLYNPRPLNVVLVNDDTGALTRLQSVADARTVLPISGDAASLELDITVPSSMAAGSYSVHIELPDGSASLADDPRYSIQMANSRTWVAASGTNDLGLDVTITN